MSGFSDHPADSIRDNKCFHVFCGLCHECISKGVKGATVLCCGIQTCLMCKLRDDVSTWHDFVPRTRKNKFHEEIRILSPTTAQGPCQEQGGKRTSSNQNPEKSVILWHLPRNSSHQNGVHFREGYLQMQDGTKQGKC